MFKKVYRTKDDGVGKDYTCSKCRIHGYRLWRFAHSGEELLCAKCGEKDQAKQIERYKHLHHEDEVSCTIGDLLPARACPEGDNFWGHSSGDTSWWYKMPQYEDAKREADLVRKERDHFQQQSEHYAVRWMEESKENHKACRERDEAIRFAKLDGVPR